MVLADEAGEAMTYWRMFHHVIWSTKNRELVLGEEEQRLVERSFALTMSDLDIISHAVGFMPDHVHLAVSIPPRIAVAEAVRRLKGGSSHALNHRQSARSEAFAWQSEYGVLTFGERALPDVVRYAREQKERHAAQSIIRALERTDETP
jgi:putative transposase